MRRRADGWEEASHARCGRRDNNRAVGRFPQVNSCPRRPTCPCGPGRSRTLLGMFQHMSSTSASRATLTRRDFLESIAAASAVPALGVIPRWAHQLPSHLAAAASRSLDTDLPEITIGSLQAMYAERKYTVTQVTEWYLARIARFD